MIKKIALFAVVALMAVSASAQLKFGVKGGVNLANNKFEMGGASADTKMKIGFAVGGFVNYAINDQMSLQPELLFLQAGSKVEELDDAKIELNYIAIPVMFKYSFGAMNLQAGPQLGYLLSAKFDGEDMKDDMKSIDLGLNIGAGYQIMENLGIEARYSLGLSNIADEEDVTVKNNGIQVLVSYSF